MRAGATAFRARLTGNAQLAALVGAAIYAGRAPEGMAPPFLVHRRASAQRIHALDGPTDMLRGRFQVDCYARDYAAALAIAEAAADAVQANAGADLYVEQDGAIDLYEDEVTPKLHRATVDFTTMERV